MPEFPQYNVIWHEKSAIAEISSMYFILLHELTMWQARQKPESVIDCHAKHSAVEMYCAQFFNAHWANILSLVQEQAGPALAGHMTKYNAVDLTVSQF